MFRSYRSSNSAPLLEARFPSLDAWSAAIAALQPRTGLPGAEATKGEMITWYAVSEIFNRLRNGWLHSETRRAACTRVRRIQVNRRHRLRR